MPACFVIAACYLLGIALILPLDTEYLLVNTPLAHALGVVYINIFVRMNVTCVEIYVPVLIYVCRNVGM